MTASTLIATEVTGATARIVWTPGTDPAGTADTVTLVRITGTFGHHPVMGGTNTLNTSDQWDDPETPLGIPTRWEIRTATGDTITSNTLTIQGPPVAGMGDQPGPIISDPTRGLHTPAVALIEAAKISRRGRNRALDIEGQAGRVILTHVEAAPTRTPRLLTETAQATDTLDTILATGGPVLWREPGQPPTWWQPLGDRDHTPFVDATTPHRVHQLGDTEILDGNPWPASLRAVGDTLGDLHTLVPGTLDDIADTWVTLGDLALHDIKAALA